MKYIQIQLCLEKKYLQRKVLFFSTILQFYSEICISFWSLQLIQNEFQQLINLIFLKILG
ncbi:hypothetical protein pb186bvf_008872 [Paramecium bursaria]